MKNTEVNNALEARRALSHYARQQQQGSTTSTDAVLVAAETTGSRLLRRPEQSRHVDAMWENTNRGSAKCWTKISRYVFYLRWHRLKCRIIATWNNTLWRATGKPEQCCLTIVEHRQTSLLVVLYSWTSRCWAKVKVRKVKETERENIKARGRKKKATRERKARTKKGQGQGQRQSQRESH